MPGHVLPARQEQQALDLLYDRCRCPHRDHLQVTWLSATFPPGRHPSRRGNPPSRRCEVVGREHGAGRHPAAIWTTRERGASGALLLVGEAGIGKTTLLDAARSMASDFRCLSTRGRRVGVGDRVRRSSPDAEPGPRSARRGPRRAGRRAWRSARAGRPPRLRRTGSWSRRQPCRCSRRPPLPARYSCSWTTSNGSTTSPASALAFAARRLGSDAVAFVLTARIGSLAPDLVQGLPVIEVTGLSAGDASGWSHPDVAAAVADAAGSRHAGQPAGAAGGLAAADRGTAGRCRPAARPAAGRRPAPGRSSRRC